MEECKFCVTVANPQSEDSPLIAVSEEFETMTGFSRHEILGVNCRFLNQGVDMNPQERATKTEKRREVEKSSAKGRKCGRWGVGRREKDE